MSDPYTPEQAAEATQAQRDEAPPVGTSLPPGTPATVAAGSADEVDVAALLERMQAQMNAQAEQIRQLRSSQAPAGEHPLVLAALAGRDQLAVHFSHKPHDSSGDVLRLADDVVDAARQAVESGDVSVVRGLGERVVRAISRARPDNGQNHYLDQAADHFGAHLPDAADTVTDPAPPAAGAIGSSRPAAPVIQGSVTGGGTSVARGLFARA